MKPRSSVTVKVDGEEYVPVWWLEHMHDRKHRTIRTWIHRNLVRSTVIKGTRYVHYGDAIRRHQAAEQRKPRERVLKSGAESRTGFPRAQKRSRSVR